MPSKEFDESVMKETIFSMYPQIDNSTVDLVIQTFSSLSDCLQNLYFISNVSIDQDLLEKKYNENIIKIRSSTKDETFNSSNEPLTESHQNRSKTPPPPVDNAFSNDPSNESPELDHQNFNTPTSTNLSPVSSYTTDTHNDAPKFPQTFQSDITDTHSSHSNDSNDLFSNESSSELASSKPSSQWSSGFNSSAESHVESGYDLEPPQIASVSNTPKTHTETTSNKLLQSETQQECDAKTGEYDEEFNNHVEFLAMSFPDISKSVISQTLLDNDKDPVRASDVLLSYDTLSQELEKVNIDESYDMELPSSEIEEDDPIKFLKMSFPELEEEKIVTIFKSNDEDLVRSLDDLLSMQAIDKGEIEHDVQEFDTLTFLKVSFPESSEDAIEKALKENNGDVLAASEELLNMDLIREISNQNIRDAFQRDLSSVKTPKKSKKDKFKPAAEMSDQKNIEAFSKMFDLNETDAAKLYQSHGGNLYSAMDAIMSKSTRNKTNNRALTKLDMKVKQTSQFFSNASENSSPNKATTVQGNSYASAAAASSAYSLQRPDPSELQRIREEERETRMAYIRQATEAYKKSSSNPLYRSVAGHYMGLAHQHSVVKSARLMREFDKILEAQTFPYSIDLHNLSVNYAVSATRLKLENWWTKEASSGRKVHPLRIITGSGQHSLNEIPRIKLAVEKLLNEDGWKYDKHRAHFDVYGPKR